MTRSANDKNNIQLSKQSLILQKNDISDVLTIGYDTSTNIENVSKYNLQIIEITRTVSISKLHLS